MKRVFVTALLMVFLFGNTVLVFPEENSILHGNLVSLEDGIKRALVSHDQIRLAEIRIEKETALEKGARDSRYPVVKTGVDAFFVTEKNPGVFFWTNEVNLPLFDGGKRKSVIKQHQLRKEEFNFVLKNEKANLEYKIKEIYVQTLAEKELTELCESWFRESRKLYQSFKDLYRRELATKVELYHARALFKTARYEHIKHKEAYDYGINLLTELLSLNSNERLELRPFDELTEIQLTQDDFLKNPLYEIIKLRVKEKEEERREVRSSFFPQVSLTNRYRIAKDSFLDQNRFEAGIQGTWRIWDFGETKELMKAKALESKEAELAGRIEANEFQDGIRGGLSKLTTARAQIGHTKADCLEKKEIYNNQKTKLIANETGRLTLFSSYVDYIESKVNWIEAVSTYQIMQAKLVALKGNDL